MLNCTYGVIYVWGVIHKGALFFTVYGSRPDTMIPVLYRQLANNNILSSCMHTHACIDTRQYYKDTYKQMRHCRCSNIGWC